MGVLLWQRYDLCVLQHLVRCEHIAPAALDHAATVAVLFQYFMPLIVTYLLHIRDLLSPYYYYFYYFILAPQY